MEDYIWAFLFVYHHFMQEITQHLKHNWYEDGQCWMVYDLEMYGNYKHRSTHRTQSLDETVFDNMKRTSRLE